ncbi:hypothetical protein [uncultured Draconibacterium sp.]|uniref:hypothetical protein n=1 Tax=uncultured Draconibacterium sp. TaxID=1573823 RepID=UPI003749E797
MAFYQNFLSHWGKEFNKLIGLKEFLDAYCYVGEQLEDIELLKTNELEKYQTDWLWLIEHLEHSEERDFFQQHWVPLQKDKYEYFLDLSVNPFCIFKVNFHPIDPMHWYAEEVVSNLAEYIMGLEDGSIGYKYPTEDEDGNPIDQNGKRIYEDSSNKYIPKPINEFTGYDKLSITDQATQLSGHILESPIEAILVQRFGYNPVSDNSQKPYSAWWNIENKKLLLHLANAEFDGKKLYTGDIVPETQNLPDEEYLFYYTSFNGTLCFVVDKITEPGIASYQMKIGDKIYISVKDGMVTSFEKL